MADSSSKEEELAQMVKKIGTYLTLKMSSLLRVSAHDWSAHSIGAIVGLAVTVVFMWKLLRTPSGQHRGRHHLQGSMSGTAGVGPSNESILTSRLTSSLDNPETQDAISDFFQPAKLTLGHIVRQRLSEGRKVTCRLLGVVLEENDPEELQERVLKALEDAGAFGSGGLIKDKVLFCSTENGRTSFVRQLEPDWHIDSNLDIISQLARFIRYELFISPSGAAHIAPNVFTSVSLEQFFGSPRRN
ncbi:peroxisome biogenesis protein 22 isoform X2 [Nymphaea colorata]|uniref:peroxisome biogenesis protein 22 isoform X2 n=1 Tax=Nymphaea colorata TaxID=210225 RepID=UPI00129D87F4|nr:peroxisome biogenesis protein 22 isoform X2 [Nymphaea colorata]